MADHGAVEIGTASGTDFADHLRTYHSFLAIAKWGTISVIVLLVLLAFLFL